MPGLTKLESPLSKPRASTAEPPRLRVEPLSVLKDSLPSVRPTVTLSLPKASSSSPWRAFSNCVFTSSAPSLKSILFMMSDILIFLVVPLKVTPSSLPPDHLPSSPLVPPRYSLVETFSVSPSIPAKRMELLPLSAPGMSSNLPLTPSMETLLPVPSPSLKLMDRVRGSTSTLMALSAVVVSWKPFLV